MAKTITSVDFTVNPKAASPYYSNTVVAHVTMPVSELAAFLVLAGLTNAVSATVTTPIIAVGDSGGR